MHGLGGADVLRLLGHCRLGIGRGDAGDAVRPTKLSRLCDFMAAGDWPAALRLAATFPRLGDHRDAITRGREACARPDFYRQIGKDPDALVAAGVAALKARYARS